MAQVKTIIADTRWLWLAAGLVLGLVLSSGTLSVQAQSAAASTSDAMTVYVAGHGAKKLTENVNAAHKRYAPAGWAPVAVTDHEENNDLKGLWVTYVRTR
jgi:hypothetical protein